MWKIEKVSPVPKKYPPETENDIRKFSGTHYFSKLFERFIVKWIHEDVDKNLDPANYGGVKGKGTAHYIVKLIHDMLKNLDNNSRGEINAIIATFYDWSKAFDIQCHRLGILSFIECGVRPCLIPLLVSYLQERSMTVKYRTAVSSPRNLPGGGAQGTLIGPMEYACQSNKSANCVEEDKRYKFIDDLTTIEVLDILMKIVSYNFHNHVASDNGSHGQYIPKEEIKTQTFVTSINEWTDNQKMKLNTDRQNTC